ncbi:MAG TPA: RagB/SusD family nutrient uptake outer membrane protein [Chitinophagaceae bacterium]|nr:RagB/SusD family nutrient uptake outer membrane protein [Chitinophagaceae bacterium]
MKSLRIIIPAALITTATVLYSCKKDFLVHTPQGSLSADVLATPAGINGLLIGAYAALDGQDLGNANPWSSSVSNWIWGSVVGTDASKGSYSGDQQIMNEIFNYSETASNTFFEDNWKACYEGISRCNNVLSVLPNVTGLSDADSKNIEAQAKFLRGHYYFELKRCYNMVPWIDETTTDYNQPNDQDIWPKIEADFEFAAQNLPETQADLGRANKWAAVCYLGKTYLYEHKYTDAQTQFDDAIANGETAKGVKYDLFTNFEDNWRPEDEGISPEAVFPVEMAANVGTNSIDNANYGDMLNFPYGSSPFGCCGFFQPRIDLVNSFRTDANGLPYLDNYNDHPVKNDRGLLSSDAFTPDTGNLDPRVDWTAGRRGLPFHDWGIHPGADWIRDQNYAGPYANKKNIYWQATPQYHDASSWAPGSAINYLVIRFADVLLMNAECHAQNGDLSGAEDMVNKVRNRAANKSGWLYKYKDNSKPLDGFSTTPAANYAISPYPAGYFSSKDVALKAIYFERKLELAMEGHRFFDLVRWGIAEQTINTFIAYESQYENDISPSTKFKAPTNNYFPIPQNQIDITTVNGTPTLTQNPGY